jgi:PAS domain S-box-containing protein
MSKSYKTRQELLEELDELRAKVAEAHGALRAIQAGEVDGLILSTPEGERVFTLSGADLPYRVMIENMNEGAVTLSFDGTILFCNQRFADIVRSPLEKMIGSSIYRHSSSTDLQSFQIIVEQSAKKAKKIEFSLQTGDGDSVPVMLSISPLDHKNPPGAICLIVTDLTEQKHNEQILAEEKLTTQILRQTKEILILCNQEGHIIRASQSAERLLGKNPIHQTFDETFKLQYPNKNPFVIEPAINGKPSHGIEVVLNQDNTRLYTFLLSTNSFITKNGFMGTVVIMVDITKRKQAEAALRENEERMRLVLRACSIGTFEVDFSTGDCRWNEVEFELLGLKPGDTPPGPDVFFRYVHSEDVAMLQSQWDEAFKTGYLDAEFRVIRPDREVRWLAGKGKIIFQSNTDQNVSGSGGQPRRFMGVNFDITERKKAEEALVESERRERARAEELAALLDAIPAPVFFAHDPDCLHITGNMAADELLKSPPGGEASLSADPEVRPRNFRAFKDGRELGVDELPSQRAARGEKVRDIEFSLVFEDGSINHVLGNGSQLLDESGNSRGSILVLSDITKLKKTEEALQATSERLKLAQIVANAGVWDWDIVAGHIEWSSQMFKILGLDKQGANASFELWEKILHPEDREVAGLRIEQALENQTILNNDYRVIHPDGGIRWINAVGKGFYNDKGQPVRMIGFCMDITARKRTEEELRNSQAELEKRVMERTAELSASVIKLEQLNAELQEFTHVTSHDLQEPLRKIMTFSEMAKKHLVSSLDNKGRDYLDLIANSASRMRQLLNDLYQLSMVTGKLEPFKVTDLEKIAHEAADLFAEDLHKTGGVVKIQSLPGIEADETQMLRLFQNLIGNSIKYHGIESIQIEISAKHNGEILVIFVKDNGIGFEQEFAERIFKPFQRLHTRGEYKGAGMGLAICRKIVERHNGSIRAEGLPGKGSTFIITLPINQDRNGGTSDN